jgi:transitional endoplasmic reticulum ATPase
MRDQNKNSNDTNITLRIKDAIKEDSGKGRIRIDPEIIKELKFKNGDAIEIFHPITKCKTVGILYPGKSEDFGSGALRLDPFLRRNLRANIDDFVEISKIRAEIAQKVVFASLAETVVFNPKHLNVELENRVVTKDDIMTFYSYGNKLIEMIVVDFQPKVDAVRIALETEIRISEKTHKELIEREELKVSYDDIGGLADEIRRIREIIELPIKHPEIFQRLGLDFPRGVLLYGPSGTGKTLLARAIAFETDAYFITISGPEIMSKFYGQTSKNLRDFFEEAKKNAPSIIVIDELDAIASRKESSSDVENRTVSQLLSLLDGVEDRGRVIVIGLTNKLELLEPALLSPGRFDKIIEFHLPDEKGREEIFRIHTKRIPITNNISFKELASRTQNFTGADIYAVCKDASFSALRRQLTQNDLNSERIAPGLLEQIKILNCA